MSKVAFVVSNLVSQWVVVVSKPRPVPHRSRCESERLEMERRKPLQL